FPVLGKFGVERNTRMRASGTVREVRAAFAAFAGTKEERTRVFVMRMDDPEGTYRVLCPPPPPPPHRCSSSSPRQRRGRRRRSAGGEVGGAVTEEEPPAGGDAAAAAAGQEGLSGSPASVQVVGFTTARALVEGTAGHLGVDSADPPLVAGVEERGTSVSACSGAIADEREVEEVEERLAGDARFGGSSSGGAAAAAAAGDDDSVKEDEDRESEVVVLGDRGSNIILRVYVEEVPERGGAGDRDEEESVSLAVKVATDQPNRITVTLDLTGGIEGPWRMSADKRWTSDQLREAIAQAIGRPNRSFRLRKCHGNTPEIRPGPETLAKKGFYNLIKLHVSPGRPLELHEEAVTVAPVDVGFRVGLGPAPTSVVLAVAAGRVRARISSADSAAVKEEGAGQQQLGHGAAPTAKVGLGDCRSLNFPEVDAEMGPVAMFDTTTAPPSADCSPTLGPVGDGCGVVGEGDSTSTVVASDLLLTLRGVGAATGGGDSSGGSEAPTASVSSSETGQTTPTNRGIALLASEECKTTPTDQEAVAPFAPPSPPRPSSAVAAAPPVGAAAAAAAHPGSAAAGTGASPEGGVAWAAAAFATAAAVQDAKAETEALTSTYVEVVPPESRWGEHFNVAVHRDSTVGDIRRAVWTEMRRRGLGPRRSSAAGADVGNEEEKDDRLPTPGAASTGHPLEEGWTPGALRLRERHVKLPATIVRDADGKVTRLRSRPRDAPWLLVAQILPREEDLGRPVFPHGGGGGGGGSGDSGDGSAETGVCGDPGGDADGADAARDDCPPQDARVIVVQWWNRWEWRLTEKYEAWVSPTETVASARRRLAEQAGVDPANLLANRCAPNARLRLFDLRGTASERGDGPGGSPAAEKQSSGTWGGSFSHDKCHWSDLEASRGDQPVGGSAISEGSLVLLQDSSQPLKQLAPATEASIAGGGGGGGNGTAAADSGTTTTTTADAACALSSVGPWYAGGASSASDVGGGATLSSSSTATSAAGALMLPASKSSSSSYSYKPKERALRIRTRRDRLEEGRVVAAAAAAAAAVAAKKNE
ncbi:unnamed protein product, partial [Ectocarpus sp. 12 AP-2014]